MLNLLNQSRDNNITAIRNLLKLLKIPVAETILADTVFTHPDYPSLLSLSDSLQHCNIATAALKTTTEKLYEFPAPFIVHLTKAGGQFFAVKKCSPGKIIYLNEQGKEKQFSPKDFFTLWDGVILLAETSKDMSDQAIQSGSEESGYKKAKRKEWWDSMRVPIGFLILVILGIVQAGKVIFYMEPATVYYTLFMLFSLMGMIITGLLLWHEYDGNNLLLQKVCSAGKHSNHSAGRTGCQAVLGSKASKAIGNVTWSEIGFIYFTGSYLYLLMAGISSLPLLMALNILALPYIIFSIYYQAHVAKQWCVLCLSVQSLLLLEFLSTIFTNQLITQPFNHLAIQPFILSFFLPTFTWFYSKPYLYAAKKGKQFHYQLARLKNNEDVFSTLLQKQPALPHSTDEMGIIIGNPDARNTLIKVCNPYCGPCAQAHPKIEELIHNNPNWKTQIIFTATGEEKDKRTAPAAHLMAIAAQQDEMKTQQALDDWYNPPVKDYNEFANKYPLNGEIQQQGEKLKAMNEWCEKTGISFTPTFFVFSPSLPTGGESPGEGYQLPEIYSVEDLKYLLG